MEETRVLLRNVGKINAESAAEYRSVGGYEGLKKAVSMDPQAIIDMVSASGLRGRGGAGFPTGFKWTTTLKVEAEQKYIVCNADEGEPGTNKDRFLLAGDPHSVFEGMAIAGKAVGATKGYIYLRGEYSYIFPILENAIASAREEGCLGENLFGSDFSFDIQVVSGGGAYVCGEETALLNSMEGKRGEPRQKPPFPGVVGLYGRPTVVNNVETLANVPLIVENGADWFRGYGTEKCPGTKLYTISGNVKRPGTYEFPMGANLKELIYDVCGGIAGDKELLAVQTGGASCPVITADQIDVNLDVEQAAAAGASLGSGAMLVIDESNDLIDVLKNIAHFFMDESCGKCTPCREGTKRIYQLISKFADNKGTREDLQLMKDLSSTMSVASFCALGQTATSAIATAMVNFPEIFEAHMAGAAGAAVKNTAEKELQVA
jgi:NADH:ubiquinone oxidoreductase subunit F (NADH-binding)